MAGQRYYGDGVMTPVFRTSAPALSAAGFTVCPLAVCPVGADAGRWAQDVYRLAYEQARAALLPPRHERLLLASPN
jgi:hypothetical protein